MADDKPKFDFGGWATKFNLKCTDGRTIKHGAFRSMDGEVVPLVWQHFHDEPSNILGQALLEHRDEGVYAYCTFNNSKSGQDAKEAVRHGDVKFLSIFANHLIQNGSMVHDGKIRETSLVMAGANPGAVIEQISMTHSDGSEMESDEDAIIFTGIPLELAHADTTAPNDDPTIQEVFDSMTPMQQNVVYIMMSQALDDAANNSTATHSDDEGDTEIMKENAFDKKKVKKDDGVALSHDDFKNLLKHAKDGGGSFRNAFIAHAGDYGINDIEFFFPDARNTTDTPVRIARDTSWVTKVLDGAKHVPFSRIKTLYADFKAELNRARGYVKGAVKEEGIITALKRITTPTTIYHKQKLDKDDIDDITDFDVVTFMKADMRVELDEEVARAALISDGRAVDDDDKINEENIRPIYKDSDVYVERVRLADDADAEDMIEAIIRSRENYLGTGDPTLFLTAKTLTDMLLLKDGVNRRLYSGKAELMSTLMVSDIVVVPVMSGVSRVDTAPTPDVTLNLLAILVNMKDYTFGANKGGALSLFDDFDIDVNQYKYLIETRLSGSLTLPKSAIVVEQVAPAG